MVKKRKKACPQCGKPATWKGNPFRPFCSERCKIIDLGEWATEKYRISDKKADDESNEKDKDGA